jgi:hypothetical protein
VSIADALLLLYMPPLQVNVKVSVPALVGVTVIVPLADCVPLHAPLAMQEVPLVADHVSADDCPAITVVGLTLIEIDVAAIDAAPAL